MDDETLPSTTQDQAPPPPEAEEEIPFTADQQPLTLAQVQSSISLLARTVQGTSHAYTRLEIHDAQITSLGGHLKGFPHLRYIDLSENHLVTLEGDTLPENLLSLNLQGNFLTSLGGGVLAGKKYLQHLNLAKNKLKELPPAGVSWPILTFLNANENKLTESSVRIDSFPELQHLELRGNRLQCPPLKFDAPKLTRLYLAANNITSLKGLDSLTMLQVLNLRGNKIENLDGLDVLTSLVYLNLRSNKVENQDELSKLSSLGNLRTIVFLDNPITAIDNYRIDCLTKLPKLDRLDKESVTVEERDEVFANAKAAEEAAKAAAAEAAAAELAWLCARFTRNLPGINLAKEQINFSTGLHHSKGWEMSNPQSLTVKKQRIRTTTSCDECSRRRRKCNGDLPCSLCVEKKRDCRYTRRVLKRGPKTGGLDSMMQEEGVEGTLKRKAPRKENPYSSLSSTTIPSSTSNLSQFQTARSVHNQNPLIPSITMDLVEDDAHSFASNSNSNSAYSFSPLATAAPLSATSSSNSLLDLLSTHASSQAYQPPLGSPIQQQQQIRSIPDKPTSSFQELGRHLFKYTAAFPACWDYFDFFTRRSVDSEGQLLSFPDYYFKWVYPHIPGLPRYILEDRMADVPLYLLHIFYALCLIIPKRGSLVKSAVAHFQHAASLIQDDLEDASPWTVCGFLHLAKFALMSKKKDVAMSYHSLAISLCHFTGISRDVELTWISPIGTSLNLKQFQRSLYLHLYRLDLYTSVTQERMPLITDPIAPSIVFDFALPNSLSESTNSLTFAKYYAPLLSITRQIMLEEFYNVALSPEFQMTMSMDLQRWYDTTLPPFLKYPSCSTSSSPQQSQQEYPQLSSHWKGRHASIISYHYHTLHLLLLRSPFLSAIQGTRFHASSADPIPVVESVLCILRDFQIIAQAFLTGPITRLDVGSVMTKHFFFYVGLFVCVLYHMHIDLLSSNTQSQSQSQLRTELEEIMQTLLLGLELMYIHNGVDHVPLLKQCMATKGIATRLLRTNPIKWRS